MTEDLVVNNTGAVIPSSIRARKNKQSSALLRFFGLRNQNDHLKSPLPLFRKGCKKASLLSEVARSARGFENTLCHSEAKAEESQSLTQRNDCTLTPTPSSNWRGGKKPAFTLAEVLVTLGIIGVVAAMTFPMLARNYQFFIRQQQFKKAYSTISIATQKTQIDLGEGVRCYYGAGSQGGGERIDCDYFYDEFAKNLHLLKTCKGNAYRDKCLPEDFRGGDEAYASRQAPEQKDEAMSYYKRVCGGMTTQNIKNNSTVYVSNAGFLIILYGYRTGKAPLFVVDINAHKKPNKWGHDIFAFNFNKEKLYDSVFILIPASACQALDEGGYYTKDFFNYLYGQGTNY